MSDNLFNYTFNINNQNQAQATSSAVSGARDVPPAPNSYFFTEASLDDQLESGAFGPMHIDPLNPSTPANPEDKFRITSVFESTTNKKVFAPCAGRIFIQPSPDNTKVNVLIKPLGTISGLNIKYFIFRGLKNDDFFESTIKVRKLANSTNPTDFLTRIWSIYNYWNSGHEDSFHSKYLGYNIANQALTDDIDKQFYKSSDVEVGRLHELYNVKAGEWIGNFESKLGVDIVLSEGEFVDNSAEFKLDLAFLRLGEVVLDMNDYATNYEKKRIREAVFRFIDPAAFYGFHVNKGSVKLYNSGSFTNYTNTDIYNNILHKFYNKHKIYIYLKSNYNRSYNYYKNYTAGNQELHIGADESSLSFTSYNTSLWPVLIYDTAQTTTEDFNKLFLKLICDNSGVADNKAFYNLSGNLQGDDKDGNWAYGLNNPICVQGETLTNAIEYRFDNIEGSGQKYFISNFLSAFYIGKDLPILNEPTSNTDSVKDLFSLVNSGFLFSNNVPSIEEQYSFSKLHLKYSDKLKQLITNKYIMDGDSSNNKIAIETIASDYDQFQKSDAAFENIDNINKSVEAVVKKSSFKIKTDGDNFYELNTPYFFNRKKNLIDTLDLMCLSIISLDDSLLRKSLFGFTKDLLQAVVNYVQTNNLTNLSAYLQFDSIINYGLSNGEKCYKYKFKITCENTNNEYAFIDLTASNTTGLVAADFDVYSLDKQVFFTKKYTDGIQESKIDTKINFNSFNNTSLKGLSRRLISNTLNPDFYLLYDLEGFVISYKDDIDTFGFDKTGNIKVPVGTKVIHLGDKVISPNNTEMAYVVFYHIGKFREGFIDKSALGDPDIRIKTADAVAKPDLHIDCFLDDAELILKYNSYIYEQPYAKFRSREFTALIEDTNALYKQLTTSFTRAELNSKLITLFTALNDVSSPISLLPVPNNRAATSQKIMDFPAFKRIADKDMPIGGKYLLMPFTDYWIDKYSKLTMPLFYDPNASQTPAPPSTSNPDCDSDFNTFISNANSFSYILNGVLTHFNYSELVTGEYDTSNGAWMAKPSNEYNRVIAMLIGLRNYFLNRTDVLPITITPEVLWLTSKTEAELLQYIKIVIIHEKIIAVNSPLDELVQFYENEQIKIGSGVMIDDSVGFLNSQSCLSLYIHEMNTGSFNGNMLVFDTHSFVEEKVQNQFEKMKMLLRNNSSCTEYFSFFNFHDGDKPDSAPGGNWVPYLTSFHKNILYLNYFLNKLL